MAVHETLFPTIISYGSRGGPGFSTGIVEQSSGHEERVGRWESPRRVYDVAWGLKTLDNLALLQTFFQARTGALFGFRYKDPLDFTSALNGRDAPTALDQVIEQGDGVELQYQLRKTYPEGPSEGVSTITKPVASTVLVALDAAAQTEGVDYTIDGTTGVITFAVAPAGGVTITAGFEMHWPCRFGEEADRGLQATIDGFENGNIGQIPVVEIRDELVAFEDTYAGGNLDIEDLSGADVQLSRAHVSVRVRATDGVTDLLLPDPTKASGQDIPHGGPHWFIFNHSLVNTIEVRDHAANLVATIGTDDGITIVLGSQTNDTAIERFYLTDASSGVTTVPPPWNGTFNDDLLLSTVTVAEGEYTEILGAGSSANVGWFTPVGEPGTNQWNDAGHTLTIDVKEDVFGSGVASSLAAMYRVSADGETVLQSGGGSPSQAFIVAGTYVYAVPATAWSSPSATDRFVAHYHWQAGFGGGSKRVKIRTGNGTSYFDSSVTDAPSLRQWLAF